MASSGSEGTETSATNKLHKTASLDGPLPPAHHAFTAPATTGRLQRGETLGQMHKGRSTILGWKPAPEDLMALRERRYMSGLWHLNGRLDILDAGHHVIEQQELEKDGRPDPDVIVFEGPNDPLNAQNWSFATKVGQTALLGMATLVCTYASSVFSTGTQALSKDFGVSAEVGTLSTSRPCIWGPASELYGRRLPLLASYVVFAIFNIPVAVAQNLETVMLGRFLTGCGAAGPLAIVAGAFSDYWSAEARGAAITVFGVASVAGPAVGPVMGNFIVNSYLTWRWTAWITLIWASLMLVIMFFFLKESYAPVLLQQKAKKIRYSEKRWAVRSKLDIDFNEILHVYVSRPILMLVQEPILFAVSLYSGFAILYLLFGAVPYVMVEQRGLSPGIGGLVFISIFIGAVLAGGVTLLFSPRYNRILHETHAIAVPKERCLPMMVGSPEYVSSVWPSIVGVGLVGFGFLLIFLSALNLIVDCYLMMANSAFAANTMLRSALAASFPLFGTIMYKNLGTQWASALLGFLAIFFMPFPMLLCVFRQLQRDQAWPCNWLTILPSYFFADTLIAKSKYAPKIPPHKPAAPSSEKSEKQV